MFADKTAVQASSERASCGEGLYLGDLGRDGYVAHGRRRYEIEPYLDSIVGFAGARARKVLEIGVRLRAEHQQFAESGVQLSRIELISSLSIGRAVRLSFVEGAFCFVYSWSVVHHSPDTRTAIAEIYRVRRRSGTAKIMANHEWSIVVCMLWLADSLLRLKTWMTLANVYASYLESPGTKAFLLRGAKRMFRSFSPIQICTVLTHRDLLESAAGQRHVGVFCPSSAGYGPERCSAESHPATDWSC